MTAHAPPPSFREAPLYSEPPKKPVSLIVFGILLILFGLMGLCGIFGILPAVMKMPPGAVSQNPTLQALQDYPVYRTYTIVTSLMSSLVGAAAIASGIGLIMGKEWARLLALVYAVYTIIFTVVNVFVQWKYLLGPITAKFGNNGPAMIGVYIGLGFGLIILALPVCILIFLTRPPLVAYCRGQAASVTPSWSS